MSTRFDRLRRGASGGWGQSRHKRVDRGRSLVAGGVGYGRAGEGYQREDRAYPEVRVAQARLHREVQHKRQR
jgi:hypothetical protein